LNILYHGIPNQPRNEARLLVYLETISVMEYFTCASKVNKPY